MKIQRPLPSKHLKSEVGQEVSEKNEKKLFPIPLSAPEDDPLLVCRFFTILKLFLLVLFSIAVGTVFIYRISVQELEMDDGKEFYNNRPIIGIMSEEYYPRNGKSRVSATASYIAASYVKFIEGGGGRVVPIMINQTSEYYDKIFRSINGILFPGGGVYFNDSGYATAGKYLLTLSRQANDDGDYFPIWGTCLGFEYIIYAALGDKNVLASCNASNITNKLQFTADAKKSRLFGRASSRILQLLATESVTSNFHTNCLTSEILEKHKLEEIFKILSWSNSPADGFNFVSSFEHREYPIYGVQFHPEKNMYEWSWKSNIPHSSEAVLVGQYFAQFFVNEARKSRHSFPTEEEVAESLIYNYNVNYTGGPTGGNHFEQAYFFPMGSHDQ